MQGRAKSGKHASTSASNGAVSTPDSELGSPKVGPELTGHSGKSSSKPF